MQIVTMGSFVMASKRAPAAAARRWCRPRSFACLGRSERDRLTDEARTCRVERQVPRGVKALEGAVTTPAWKLKPEAVAQLIEQAATSSREPRLAEIRAQYCRLQRYATSSAM